MQLSLPRSWNAQFALLVGLLYAHTLLFLLAVYSLSPVFDTPASERYALFNQVGIAETAARTPTLEALGDDASLLDHARWHWQSAVDWMDSLTATGESATHPSYRPSLPRSSSAPLLHAHRWPDQLRFHVHSQSPYMFRYLDHTARAFQSREQMQKHMMEHTIREKVWKRAAQMAQGEEDAAATTTKTDSAAATTGTEPAVAAQQTVSERTPDPAAPKLPSTPANVPAAAAAMEDTPSTRAAIRSVIASASKSIITPQCAQAMGSAMMQRWEGTRQVFCEPPGPAAEIDESSAFGDPSSLVALLDRFKRDHDASQIGSTALPLGRFDCRSTTLPFMPPPTAPHSYCSARNLFIDLSKFSPASEPRFRAGYTMGHLNHYHYGRATFSAQCKRTSSFAIQSISADHQRDIVDAMDTAGTREQAAWRAHLELLASSTPESKQQLQLISTFGALQPPSYMLTTPLAGSPPAPPLPSSMLLVLPHTLLIITRENGEHCNFFHTMTDLFNAYLMMHTFGLQRSQTQVLMLDNHKPGPFDDAWGRVFSGAGPLIKAHQLLGAGFATGHILAGHAVVVPPGYSSPLYRHLFEEDSECAGPADLMQSFASFFLEAYGVQHTRWTRHTQLEAIAGITAADVASAFRLSYAATPNTTAGFRPYVPRPPLLPPLRDGSVLHILVVSRRPYDSFVDHKKIARQMLNEDVLFECITADSSGRYDDVRLHVVDFARINMEQQLRMVASADVLVGMHGAALSHTLFLPPWSALLELHPMQQKWLCFKHQTEWSGHGYFAWRNARPQDEGDVPSGSGVRVDPGSFQAVLDQAIDYARNKRTQMEQEIRSQMGKA